MGESAVHRLEWQWRYYYMVVFYVRGTCLPTCPGARFSKVTVTFQARNEIFKSKYKEQERGSWLAKYSILFH